MADIDEISERLRLAGWRGYFAEGRRSLARSAGAGNLHRIRRGVYTPSAQTDDRSMTTTQRAEIRRQRYVEEAVAVVRTRRTSVVLSHFAAAAIWGLPVSRSWPPVIDILVEPHSRIASKNRVRVHRDAFNADDVVELGDIWVTNPARTIFDLARSGFAADGVAALDFALGARACGQQRLAKEDVLALIDDAASSRGLAVASAVVDFADGRAASPGESRSRIAIYRAGFARPELQVRHPSSRREYYETDFEWLDVHSIGEYDGQGKYQKENLPVGMDPGQAVYEEKLREDELRREGNTFARWGKYELKRPVLLRDALIEAGVPIVRRPRRNLGPW